MGRAADSGIVAPWFACESHLVRFAGRPLYPNGIHNPYQTKVNALANIKSQKKRNLTNEKARQRNLAVRTELKSAVRAAREAIASGDKAKADTAVKNAGRKLDKAVSKGVIHQNQAANRKSAIASKAAAL